MHLVGGHNQRGRFSVYDPRQGQDCKLETRFGADAFSSLEQGFLVVLSTRIDWLPFAAVLDELLRAADPISFVMFRPWSPGIRAKMEKFGEAFETSPDENPQEQLAVFSDGRPLVQHALSFVNSLGRAPGVLLLGSTKNQADLRRNLDEANIHSDDALFITAECATVLGVALGLDEGAQSSLFVRLSGSTTTVIDRLLPLLESAADRVVSNELC